MRKYKLDLSEYEVSTQIAVKKDDGSSELESRTDIYPLRENISVWLRGVGIFKSAEDIAEAVSLARQIRECTEDSLELDERETDVLKKALNRLVELTAEGKANLGGEVHEEAIIRVIKMEEMKG